jgi:hypothetical protein
MSKAKNPSEGGQDALGAAQETEPMEPTSGGAQPQAAEDPRSDVRAYIGPTLHRRALVAASVFRGGLNAHVAGLIAKIPEIASLIVPLSEVVAAKKRAREQGTAEYGLYQYLLSVRFDENGEVRG